jgi:hypothetical protein
MEGEKGYHPQNEQVKMRESHPQVSVEAIKKDFEKTRQEKGERYLAYNLGMNYFQAKLHNNGKLGSEFFAAQQQAIEALLPEIKNNDELNEIYSTSYQLREQLYTVSDALYNGRQLSEEERTKKVAEVSNLFKIIDSYELQISAASKPALSSEQQPPLPRLCMEATRYEIRDEVVPEAHAHDCPICSARMKSSGSIAA